ncbi:MAG: LysM peptidoglycan-binding domain-containing protein [Pseudomonadota bacterium]
MGTIKASLIVISGLGALLGGAVILRDGGVDSLSGITRVAQPPQQALPQSDPVAPGPAPAVKEAVIQDLPEPAPLAPLAEEPFDTSPRIDLVRLEPDGMALVSGTGKPEHAMEILVDGITVWSGPVDGTGNFVSFVQLPLSPIVRMMWLRQDDGEGGFVQSDGSVLLAPSPETLVTDAPQREETPSELAEANPVEELPMRPETDTAEYAELVPEPKTRSLTKDTSVQSNLAEPASQSEPTKIIARAEQAEVPPQSPSVDALVSTDTTAPETSTPLPAPVNLSSDAEGVRPLSPNPISPEQGLAVDTVRYGAEGEVILAGRSDGADRELEIFLDNQVAATARTSDQGEWQVVLPDVPAGDYRLRADLSDQSGRVAARVDIPFRRETPERIKSARIAAEEADRSAALITVQPGFSLWAIARDRYGDGFQYVTVYEANTHQIVDPNLIYPGQVLTLPAATSTTE